MSSRASVRSGVSRPSVKVSSTVRSSAKAASRSPLRRHSLIAARSSGIRWSQAPALSKARRYCTSAASSRPGSSSRRSPWTRRNSGTRGDRGPAVSHHRGWRSPRRRDTSRAPSRSPGRAPPRPPWPRWPASSPPPVSVALAEQPGRTFDVGEQECHGAGRQHPIGHRGLEDRWVPAGDSMGPHMRQAPMEREHAHHKCPAGRGGYFEPCCGGSPARVSPHLGPVSSAPGGG